MYDNIYSPPEREDSEIFDIVAVIGDDETDVSPGRTQKQPGVLKWPLRCAPLCLRMLSLLMLAGILALLIFYFLVTLEKDELQEEVKKLMDEIDGMRVNSSQLVSSYEILSKNNSQLQDEVKKLNDTIKDFLVTLEKDELQEEVMKLKDEIEGMRVNSSQLESSYEILSKNNSQLQDEVKKLNDTIEEGSSCPDGWTRFRCSCYLKFNEKKTWSESRKDCQKRGSDLVIINNKEEQDFVRQLNCKLSCTELSWIGLHRTGLTEWTWVDGSPLTETLWEARHAAYGSQTYVSCCTDEGKWIEGTSNRANWICEK